jgi:hypothetical protein
MENLVSVKSIVEYLEGNIKKKIPMSPDLYVEAAAKLNVLLSDEHEKLFDLQQKVAQMKAEIVERGETSAKATILVEATDKYRELQSQKAFIGRIVEFIRISKLQARMKQDEFRGY